MKPRLQIMGRGWYCCAIDGLAAWGVTPEIAYDFWLTRNPWINPLIDGVEK